MPYHFAKSIELNATTSRIIIKYMVEKGWCYKELASIQNKLICYLGKHIDLEQLAREERGGFIFTHTLIYPGEHSRSRSPDHRTLERVSEDLAFIELLETAQEPDITEFMKPFQENGQLNTWIRGEFPTITQPVEELEITIYMETFHQVNPWMLDSFPDIPAPIQQDHPRNPPPYRLVTRVNNNQIDAVASSHTRGHDYLQQYSDASRGDPLPNSSLEWYLEANGPFEAQNSPLPEELGHNLR
jgi:hypothetical protein